MVQLAPFERWDFSGTGNPNPCVIVPGRGLNPRPLDREPSTQPTPPRRTLPRNSASRLFLPHPRISDKRSRQPNSFERDVLYNENVTLYRCSTLSRPLETCPNPIKGPSFNFRFDRESANAYPNHWHLLKEYIFHGLRAWTRFCLHFSPWRIDFFSKYSSFLGTRRWNVRLNGIEPKSSIAIDHL